MGLDLGLPPGMEDAVWNFSQDYPKIDGDIWTLIFVLGKSSLGKLSYSSPSSDLFDIGGRERRLTTGTTGTSAWLVRVASRLANP